MKDIIISHRSALSVIRALRLLQSSQKLNNKNTINEDIYKKLPKPIDVAVDTENDFRNSKEFKFHLYPKGLDLKTLTKIKDGVYCVCPEYAVVQLAQILKYEQLFVVVCELCGTYSINENENNFVYQIAPATSILKILNFHNRYVLYNPRYTGIAHVREVLQYANNGSASPMESRMFLKFCGPRKRGFYGCKDLKFNNEVKLSNSASKIAGQKIVVPDISSRKHKVAIEYDSTQFHVNIDRSQKDKLRRDALVHDG